MELPENAQQVVRSLVVSLAPAQEIYRAFQEPEGESSLLRYYVGTKGKGADMRYTLLGGKLRDSENWREGIQREVSEEAGLRFFGIPKQINIGSWKYSTKNSGDREILLTYNPVLFCDQITIGDPKISNITTLSLTDLKKLIIEGNLNGTPIEGHLALKNSEKVLLQISPEDIVNKNNSLLKALGWVGHIEQHLQEKFQKIFNNNNKQITITEFETEYMKIISEYMRRGFEVGIKRKEETSKEETSKEETSKETRHELIKALDGGYLGKDILYYLPELARHGTDWAGLEKSTEGTQVFVNFLKQTFNGYLQEQSLSIENYQQLMKDPGTLLINKTSELASFDQFFKKRLKEVFKVNETDLSEVFGYIQSFFRDLSNEMKVADPELTNGLHQDFTLLIEVNNVNFGYLLSLFMGFDVKENTKDADKRVRFEAGRQLLLLLKGLSGLKHYQTEVSKVREGRLQTAINSFFGSLLLDNVVCLGEKQSMRVKTRQINNQNVIVDEKPVKTFSSYLRKMFGERFSDIFDFHTISVTFKEYDDSNLEKTDGLINQFLEFLSTNFPGSQLSIEDKRDYGTKNYSELQKTVSEVGGKRKGSQGTRFVRTKLIIRLDNEILEFIVYPFYSIPGENNKFWGWLETRKDDKDYVVRRLLAGENGIPSTYDLLFPPDLYPYNFQHKLHAKYHK